MNKHILLTGISFLLLITLNAQIAFTDQTILLVDQNLNSGVAMGISDMNNDGLDDIIRLDNGAFLQIDYQQTDGSAFSEYIYGNVPPGGIWALTIADVDENGYNDIAAGGYQAFGLLKFNSDGTSLSLTNLTPGVHFVQGTNFADIDNNGTIDIFSCHDDGLSYPFSNDGNGNFSVDPSLINTASTIPSDNSGNYGSVWIDYDNDGDLDMYLSKCHSPASDPYDGRRVNMLFQNDGSGNYTDVAEAVNLRPYSQSWATDFADIDNDGDLDCFIVNHSNNSMLYTNFANGNFLNITASTGILDDIIDMGGSIQTYFADFDNDGFVDLLCTGGSAHKLFKNNGDLTFTTTTNPFPTNLTIHSAALGDLNNDGYLDVYAGFATGYNSPSSNPDKLFMNTGGTNNYFDVLLEGSAGYRNGIGARVELYGAWGKQIREVRSGESYGIMNSMIRHFGIGTATTIDSLVVRWPSGQIDRLCGPSINQCLSFTEATAVAVESDFSFFVNDLSVDFNDLISGTPDDIHWDFGDNNTSTQANPSHTYTNYGTYTITLTANDICGAHITTKTVVLINPLPVELIHFQAQKITERKVQLDWQTASEKDFAYFTIERSIDGQRFEAIATLEGSGFSNEISSYNYMDGLPHPGDNYYRLKMVDLDRDFEYSSIQVVSILPPKGQWEIYPNPTAELVFINGDIFR